MKKSSQRRTLVPITGIKSALQYDLQNLPGAMPYPFAAPEVVDRLAVAAAYLHQQSTLGRTLELLIWDAYRTGETQRAIYDRYVLELVTDEGIPYEEAYVRASAFISRPSGVFPHGTGGAVDLTLVVNAREAPMGTGFDDFVPQAASDWYRENPPRGDSEAIASENREMLRSAMEFAGFVGLSSEWWHYEWGTIRWAETTQAALVLDSILPPPLVGGSAYSDPVAPHRQPVWQLGVAQVFTDPAKKAAALLHTEPGHYYVRTSHPTIEGLADFIKNELIACRYVFFTSSGLSACVTALKSLVPTDGCLVYDSFIYYEVERAILSFATDFKWKIVKADFASLTDLHEKVDAVGKVDAFFCDSPRNWWLEAIDVDSVSSLARQIGARLIVDTSVQPVQDLLSLGVDVIVVSLSKYPSLSFTAGGALLCNDSDLHSKLALVTTREGNILSPDAAMTIWAQIVSLPDRMFAVSHKTEQVAEFLSSHAAVNLVRIPDRRLCGGLVGGQLSFHLLRYELGVLSEKIIGHNSLSRRRALNLACTFGGAITTFEHFASHVRFREGIPREETKLPPEIVRLAIGCESADRIINDLRFVLDGALRYSDSRVPR